MEEVWSAAESSDCPEPLFFHQASVEAARLFFASRAPGARAVADPAGVFYDLPLGLGAVFQGYAACFYAKYRAVVNRISVFSVFHGVPDLG